MSNIVQSFDASNNAVYPVTHLRAVRDSNGTTLESMMQDVREMAVGYYECSTPGSTAAKTITIDSSVSLSTKILCKVKFVEKNTVNNTTMNINGTGAKALYYNGVRAAANNSWYPNEVVDLYYDGTNYQAKSCADTLEYDVSLHQTHEITEITTTTRTLVFNGDVVSSWESETPVSDSSVEGYTRSETNTGQDVDSTTVDGPNATYNSSANKTNVVYVTTHTYTHVVNNYTFQEAVNAVPMSYRHGGLKLRFISNSDSSISDNKYVQCMLRTTSFSTTESNWEEIVSVKTATSGAESDLDIADESGNVLARFENGHFKIKHFDSADTLDSIQAILSNIGFDNIPEFSEEEDYAIGEIVRYEKYVYVFTSEHTAGAWDETEVEKTVINTETEHPVEIKNKINVNYDFVIADEQGNAILMIENGTIKTKNSVGLNFNGNYIGFIGDSITEGWQGGSVNAVHIDERWTYLLCQKINATENNVAVGGWFYGDKEGHALFRVVNKLRTDIKLLFIAAGTNDFGHSYDIGEPFIVENGSLIANANTNTMSGGLHKLINDARERCGEIPMFIVLPLQRSNGRTTNAAGKYLKDYVDVIKEIAQFYSIPVIDMFANSQMDANNVSYSIKFFSDGLHPNKYGYNYYYEVVYKYFISNFNNF